MNVAHIHLIISHLPIIGSLLGAVVLGFAIFRKSNDIKIAAYGLFILSAIGAGIVYATGEGAEEAVEKLPGVMESIIERHEDFAIFSLISLIVLGSVSLVALFLNKKFISLNKTVAVGIFLLSIVSFGLVARTGYLGGQIRHSEIRNGGQNNGGGEASEEHDDD